MVGFGIVGSHFQKCSAMDYNGRTVKQLLNTFQNPAHILVNGPFQGCLWRPNKISLTNLSSVKLVWELQSQRKLQDLCPIASVKVLLQALHPSPMSSMLQGTIQALFIDEILLPPAESTFRNYIVA